MQLRDAANLQDLRTRLKKAPHGLGSMYREIWDQIGLMDDAQKSWAYRVIKWVLSATRPLDSDELLLATAVQPVDTATHDRSGKASGVDYLIRVCKHLIVKDVYGRIRFMHYSVQEFVREQKEI